MKNLLISLLFIFITVTIFGQSKSFIAKIDSNYIANNKFINSSDWKSFFDEGIGQSEFDVFEYDQELLNACVFFMINKQRSERNREPYKYAPELEEVAYNYVKQKSRRRLEENRNNTDRISKDFPKVGLMFSFQGKLQDFNVASIDAIDYKKGKSYYLDRKDVTTKLKLYYGDRKDKEIKEQEPINYLTYESFAKKLITDINFGFGKQNSKSKAYEYMGCYIEVDKTTLHKKRIPQAKAMIVYGGFRLKQLESNDN